MFFQCQWLRGECRPSYRLDYFFSRARSSFQYYCRLSFIPWLAMCDQMSLQCWEAGGKPCWHVPGLEGSAERATIVVSHHRLQSSIWTRWMSRKD